MLKAFLKESCITHLPSSFQILNKLPVNQLTHPSFRLRSWQKLRKREQFNQVLAHHQKSLSKHWIIFYQPSKQTRLGLIISKRISSLATQRNRLKRLCREQFRLHQYQFNALDLVIIAKRHAGLQTNTALLNDLRVNFNQLIDLNGTK